MSNDTAQMTGAPLAGFHPVVRYLIEEERRRCTEAMRDFGVSMERVNEAFRDAGEAIAALGVAWRRPVAPAKPVPAKAAHRRRYGR